LKNQAVAAQLSELSSIGLDRVNNAVAAVTEYVELLEGGIPAPQIEAELQSLKANMDTLETEYRAAQEQVDQLSGEVAELQAELNTVRAAVQS
jgi:peptidoglycan hydrolase CwlO-like protein